MTAFKYDTPFVLKQKQETVKLRELMSKIYHPYIVQERLDELNKGDEEEVDSAAEDIGYGAVCCDPRYSKATFVGCTLAVL